MVKFYWKDINIKGVKSIKLLGFYFISLEVVLIILIKKMFMFNINFLKIKFIIKCVFKKERKENYVVFYGLILFFVRLFKGKI